MNKKIIKVFILIFILVTILIFPNQSFAANDGYTIYSFDININVNENNTFDITEIIVANFTTNEYGIIRRIPLTNTIEREDGIKNTIHAKITNLYVNEEYYKDISDGCLSIEIGDSDVYVTGLQKYVIKYTYDIGKDSVKNADEFFYNIIGDEWNTSISNITFSINMPKEFNSSDLEFFSGEDIANNKVSYSVSENTIIGKYNGTLQSGNNLAVEILLPDGYFVGAKDINLNYYLIIGLSILFVLIALILWLLFGKDKTVVDTVEFYPPEGCNSAEVAFFYNGYADNKAVVSLLIYLASKGYLKIEETNKEGSSTSEDFIITKLKDYDGNNEAEAVFFNTLFMFKNSVTSSDLYNRFYITIEKIKAYYNKKENKDRIFDKKSLIVKNLLIPMMIIIFILINGMPVYDVFDAEDAITAVVFQMIGGTVLVKEILAKKAKIRKIFFVVWGSLFAGIPLLFTVLPTIFSVPIYLITYVVGIICIAILFMFRKIILKRTKFGLEMLGKIKGFKRFLETAEKEEIEKLVEKNPEYFYDVLPYTYSLGVSEKWVEQFDKIGILPPSWFMLSTNLLVNTLSVFLDLTMDIINTSMTSSPSSKKDSFKRNNFNGGNI